MPRSAPLALAAALAAGALAAPAQAALPGTTTLASGIDVSGVSVSGSGIDIDSAPDGSAVGVWLQRDGGVDHLFATRLINGTWSAAQRIDTGLATPSGPPQVSVGNGGETVIVFPNGATPNAAKLHAVTAPSTTAPLSAPATIQGDPAGWARVDVDVAANGDGYVIAHETKHVWAYRVVNGTFTPVGAGFPGPGGILNVNPAEEAGIDTQRAGHVAVDASGTTATVAWTEGSGGNYKLYARKLSGTAPADIGTAVDGAVPTVDGRPLSPSGQDEISMATGGGKTWVAFRANYTYPNGGGTVDRARLLARTFDGTSFGPAQTLDSVPSTLADVTEGAEFPQIAIDDSGRGITVSHTQTTNRAAIGNMSGGQWNPAIELPNLSELTVAITAQGTGAGFFLDQATGRSITARVLGGTSNGSVIPVTDPADGPVFTTARAAAIGDGAALLWRQGQAADGKIMIATVGLPGPPSAQPTPTPTPNTAPGTTGSAPALTNIKLSSRSIKRSNTRPIVVAPNAKGSWLQFTLNRAARVTISAERVLPGRRAADGTCKAVARGNRNRKRCTRYVVVKTPALILDRPAAGTTRVRFTGRLGGTRPLGKGAYRLNLTAADPATGATTRIPRRITLTIR
jgi:hypothetical protein